MANERIQYRNIAELQLWEDNYRQGDVGAIIQSIRQFGFNNALRVWRDGVVMAGNHTLKALYEMQRQQEDAPTGVQVDDAGNWHIATLDVSHLTYEQAKAFAIADNRTAELATNDDEQLARLLQEVAAEDDALLQATGFDGDDLDALLEELAPPDILGYESDAKRENNNFNSVGGELGNWVGLNWGNIMVSLPRDVYDRVEQYVDDPKHESRKQALIDVLYYGIDNLCSE